MLGNARPLTTPRPLLVLTGQRLLGFGLEIMLARAPLVFWAGCQIKMMLERTKICAAGKVGDPVGGRHLCCALAFLALSQMEVAVVT